jgi:hypothetical protein
MLAPPARRRPAGFAYARDDSCDDQTNSGADPMKGMILFVTGLGIVFLASTVQTWGTNWLGQRCAYPGPCFHVEWLAVGAGLSAAAYIAWKMNRKPPRR